MKEKDNILGLINKKSKALEKERQLKNKEQIILNRNNFKEMKKKNQRLLTRGTYLDEILLLGENWTDEEVKDLLKKLAVSQTYLEIIKQGKIKEEEKGY
jgi:septum formation inhibitor-activating ATPase MinD